MLILQVIALAALITAKTSSMELKLSMPIISFLPEETRVTVKKDFPTYDFVLVGEEKYVYPKRYTEVGRLYFNIEARSDDTWLVTFPRAGTTLMQELVWLINNGLDFSTALSVPLRKRSPFLEASLIQSQGNKNKSQLSYDTVKKLSSPRIAKTHFSLSLVPGISQSDCNIVYVARNPKDLAVSYYNFHLLMKNYNGSFATFWKYFQNDLVTNAPYWKHVKEAWAQKSNSNFLFVFYEDLIVDPLATYKTVAKFFGKSFTKDQYEGLVKHLAFSNFKNNSMVNEAEIFKEGDFIRQGKIAAWHALFTPELKAQANRWIEENLYDTDLQFPHVDIYS